MSLSDFLFGSNQNQTTEQKTMDPRTQAFAQYLMTQAQGLPGPGGVPLQQIFGMTPDQLQAFQQIRNAQGLFNTDFDTARQMTQEAGKGLDTEGVQSLYNQLSAPILSDTDRQNQIQMKRAQDAAAVAGGGQGANRIGVVQSNLARSQGLARGQLQSSLLGQSVGAYQNAQAQKLAAAQSINAAAAARQSLNYQDIAQLYGAGAAQQALGQKGYDVLFAQQQQQYQNPYLNYQMASNLLPGVTSAFGYTDTKTVPQQGLFQTVLGGLAGAAGKYLGNYFGGMGSGSGVSGGGGSIAATGGRIFRAFGGMVDRNSINNTKEINPFMQAPGQPMARSPQMSQSMFGGFGGGSLPFMQNNNNRGMAVFNGGNPISPLMQNNNLGASNFGGSAPMLSGNSSIPPMMRNNFTSARKGGRIGYDDGGEASNEIDDALFNSEKGRLLEHGRERAQDLFGPSVFDSERKQPQSIDDLVARDSVTRQYGSEPDMGWSPDNPEGGNIPGNMARNTPVRGVVYDSPGVMARDDYARGLPNVRRKTSPFSGVAEAIAAAMAAANERTGTGHLKNFGAAGVLGSAGQGLLAGTKQSNEETEQDRQQQVAEQAAINQNRAAELAQQKFEFEKLKPVVVGKDIWGQPQYAQITNNGFVDPVSKKPIDPKKLEDAPDSAVESMAQAMARYDIAPMSNIRRNTPFGARVMERVLQINPNYQEPNYSAAQKTLNSYLNGKDKDQVQSHSVIVDHARTLEDAARAMIPDANGNVNMRPFNALRNYVQTQLGKPGANTFEAVRDIYADEMVRAIVGTRSALGDREEIKKRISAASSPEQLANLMHYYREMAGARLAALERGYEQGTFGRKDFSRLISKGANEALIAHKTRFGDDYLQISPQAQEALTWLRHNPTHPDAPGVRKSLEGMGIKVQ